MRRSSLRVIAPLFAFSAAAAIAACSTTPPATPFSPAQSHVRQGWTPAEQATFYTEDQGSRMIPLSWMLALKQRDRQTPFLQDGLTRYGYLANPGSATPELPVGFTTSGGSRDDTVVGMTCSACHTREIRINGVTQRIDGGPAIVDFHALLKDLDDSVAYALGAGWDEFAAAVRKPHSRAALKKEVQAWHKSYNAIVTKGVPPESWGVGRLDAVGMIFNRLTGLDLGKKADDHIIAANLQHADAPVRYPFLWNASRQDKTQWPGFTTQSGLLAPMERLGRNVGEVFGVFAHFNPVKSPILHPVLGYDYWARNSADFNGLKTQERLIARLEPPQFPAVANPSSRGASLYKTYCESCHALPTSTELGSWKTPIQNVGTDSREIQILGWQADPGVLTGARLSPFGKPLANPSSSFQILATSVVGTIIQSPFADTFAVQAGGGQTSALASAPGPTRSRAETLAGALGEHMYKIPQQAPQSSALTASATPQGTDAFCDRGYTSPCYESRVLYGIWAAAPYLHNGSVPTLWDLLQPSSKRPASFDVGADYDLVNVGLARTQTGLKSTTVTTGCERINSGNSRCGHEGAPFGTELPDADKWALIEYMKGL